MKTQPMQRNEIAPLSGMNKVERYGWKIEDAPGTLTWIKKDLLVVDEAYQRTANEKRVLNIARAWSWIACGVIVVAKRGEEDCFFVIDGQHRALAALKRSDIDALPCLVFSTKSATQEAAGFFAANTGRRLPTSLEKWKAQLLCGDPTVTFADALIKKAGRVASDRAAPESVRCLTALLRAVESNRESLTRLWPLVVDVCRGHALHERVFEGLMWLETKMQDGQSLTDKRWKDRVLAVGFEGLLDGAQRAATFYARGGAKTWGMGMLEALNKGLRIRLALRDELA